MCYDRVGKDDMVFFLGDFVFPRGDKTAQYYLDQLNGKIIPIYGNHDNDRTYGLHTPIRFMCVNIGGVDYYMEHYPIRKYTYNLCGHVHDKWKLKGGHILNVGVDVWNFYPVSIDEITHIFSNMSENSLMRLTRAEIGD